MRLNKYFMLGLAGLAFAACSNDDDVTDLSENGAMVKVNINTSAQTRTKNPSTSGDDGNTVEVEVEKVTLTLTAGQVSGSGSVTFTTDGEKSALEKANDYVFTGVRNPSKLEVSINDGKAAAWALMDVFNVGLKTPMYAAETDFGTPTRIEGQPDTYNVEFTMQHELALLEFSNIKHVETSGNPCYFTTINFDGLFMNNIQLTEGTTNLGKYTDWVNASNENAAPTFDKIADADKNFKEEGKVWPASGCYAYNIFPGLPKLTLCFSDIVVSEGKIWSNVNKKGYATVEKYKLNLTGLTDAQKKDLGVDGEGYISEFKAGYVYRINKIDVNDEAIGPTIEGGEDVNIVAEITATPWTLVSGTVDWQ